MKFSIALIAKNEENTLPRLIESLSEFQKRGGEIVLLDTGSTDDTANIAESLGCKVERVGEKFVTTIDKEMADKINSHFIVEDDKPIVEVGQKLFDYASARNYIADFATNDVIATPDCDEIYTKFDIDKIEKAIENGAEQLEYNFVFSHDQYGNEAIKFMHCKFYNKKKLHWEGIVHEVLVGNAKRVFLDESIIKLEHWQNVETNRSGYLRGLALDCYLNQDNDRNSHYLGRELLWTGRQKSAIKELERHVSMNRWHAEKAQSMIYIGDAYGQLNNPEKQIEYYNKAFYHDSSRPEALIKIADFYLFNKNYLGAIAYAKASLEIEYTPFYGNNMEHYTNKPHEILYRAYGWTSKINEAKYHLDKCLEYQPINQEYLRDYQYYNDLPLVSIIIPQLGREEGLKKCLDSIKALNYPTDKIEIIIEEGDETVPVKVKKGYEKATGDLIVYGANDIEFTPNSLTRAVLDSKQKGLVVFDTGVRNNEGFICEHFLIRRDLVEKIGEIFDTDFHHVGVDDLLWKKCDLLGEAMISKAYIQHNHFSRIGSGVERDEVIDKGYSKVTEDRKLLEIKLNKLKPQMA